MLTLERLRTIAFNQLYPLGSDEEARPSSGPIVGGPRGGATPAEDPSGWTPEERALASQMASRRLAFQVLYELEVSGVGEGEARAFAEATLEGVPGLGPVALDRAAALATDAFARRRQADDAFSALAPDWPTHRQAAVDRAILRLAWAELHGRITPPKVAVNEAVELAKAFSTDKSPAFVNGLLDKILRRVEGEPEPAPAEPAAPPGPAA